MDPDIFLKMSSEPIVKEITRYGHIVYVPNLKAKYQILEKLQRFEAHKIFTAQEIILYYFLSKDRDRSMQIEEDLWQRMCVVASKWGVSSLLTDIQLVESAQVCIFPPY